MKLADTGLRIQPFQTHGKPLVLVPCRSQDAAIRFLHAARLNDRGFSLFHGPPLSGKSLVIQQFAESLPNDQAIAVVDGAAQDTASLIQEILTQFGYDHGFRTVNERFNMVRVFAMQQAASARAPLLIIENAHAMSPVVLESLCELAELNVAGKEALRIVLVSPRSLLPMIEAPAMESLSKRVTGKFLLQPLTRDETTDYVYKKLSAGGCKNPRYLMPQAVCDRLRLASGGWPGMIDRLAMLTMANAKRFPIRAEHVPTLEATRPEDVNAPSPQLILTHRHKTLDRIRFDKPQLLVGRNEFCDLRIEHDWISRQHAMLLRNGRATIVVDLKSRNGTMVNGRRVSKHVLINNDIISLGEHRLKFIDASAKQRTTLQGAGWDDTTITKSIEGFRNAITRQLTQWSAS